MGSEGTPELEIFYVRRPKKMLNEKRGRYIMQKKSPTSGDHTYKMFFINVRDGAALQPVLRQSLPSLLALPVPPST